LKIEKFEVNKIYNDSRVTAQKNQLEKYQKLILEFDSVHEIDSITTIKTNQDTEDLSIAQQSFET
jgi:hypothetical protein